MELGLNVQLMSCDSFVTQHLSDGAIADYPSKHRHAERLFWEIKLGDVNRENRWDCDAVPNARSMHSVRGYSKENCSSIAYRKLSCYCSACMQNQWRKCSNKTHVTSWSFHKITLSDGGNSDDELEEPKYEGHYEALSEAIEVGDNFALNAEDGNEEGVDFYLIKCTSTKEQLKADEVDSWGTKIEAGSYILKGFYYKQVDDYCYTLLR